MGVGVGVGDGCWVDECRTKTELENRKNTIFLGHQDKNTGQDTCARGSIKRAFSQRTNPSMGLTLYETL